MAESVGDLQQIIVDQVVKMGYKRVRLYEFDPARRILLGRKSIGFHDRSKAEAFESPEGPVPIPTQNPSRSTRQDRTAVDREPHNTINKKYPALFHLRRLAQERAHLGSCPLLQGARGIRRISRKTTLTAGWTCRS